MLTLRQSAHRSAPSSHLLPPVSLLCPFNGMLCRICLIDALRPRTISSTSTRSPLAPHPTRHLRSTRQGGRPCRAGSAAGTREKGKAAALPCPLQRVDHKRLTLCLCPYRSRRKRGRAQSRRRRPARRRAREPKACVPPRPPPRASACRLLLIPPAAAAAATRPATGLPARWCSSRTRLPSCAPACRRKNTTTRSSRPPTTSSRSAWGPIGVSAPFPCVPNPRQQGSYISVSPPFRRRRRWRS